MVVASSPVRMLIEEHAGEHLNNYRGIVAECAHQKLTLTHAQTGERRERFTARIVKAIDLDQTATKAPSKISDADFLGYDAVGACPPNYSETSPWALAMTVDAANGSKRRVIQNNKAFASNPFILTLRRWLARDAQRCTTQ